MQRLMQIIRLLAGVSQTLGTFVSGSSHLSSLVMESAKRISKRTVKTWNIKESLISNKYKTHFKQKKRKKVIRFLLLHTKYYIRMAMSACCAAF